MNILVISGRTARHPWTSGALVAATCAALARRGHVVSLLAQSVDDPEQFSACQSVATFDSFDQTATDWPLGFASWARRRRARTAHDVSLSFSRVAAGDIWMPLEPSGAAWLARIRRSHSIPSQLIAVTRHHGALRAWASDAFFVTPPAGGIPIRRVLAVGSTIAGEFSRALHRARHLGDRVVRVDPFGVISPPDASETATLRARTRATLGIDASERVLLVSAPAPVGGLLDSLIAAIADSRHRHRERAAVLLVLARDCFALQRRVGRLGAAERLRIISLTREMPAALAAADAVALPTRTARGLFEHGGSTRLAAEALAFGRPLLAVSGAPGYGMARLRSTAGISPGTVVDTATKGEWELALTQLANDDWLAAASGAATELGAPMTFERFTRTLEATLTDAAREREEDPDAAANP